MHVTALTARFKLNEHVGLVDGKRGVEAIVANIEYLKGDARRTSEKRKTVTRVHFVTFAPWAAMTERMLARLPGLSTVLTWNVT